MEDVKETKEPVIGEYLFKHEPRYRRLFTTTMPNGIYHRNSDAALMLNTLQLLVKRIEFTDDELEIEYVQDAGMKVYYILEEWMLMFKERNIKQLVDKMLAGHFDRKMEEIFMPLWSVVVGYYQYTKESDADLIYSKEMKFMYPYEVSVTDRCKNYRFVTVKFKKCIEYEARLNDHGFHIKENESSKEEN